VAGGALIATLGSTYVICEAGVTSFGDRDLAHRQIDVAADAGADAVKFQAWITEDLVSRPAAARLAPELGDDWFDRLKARELDRPTLTELQAHAVERGLTFFATPHDDSSLEFLASDLDVPILKVGSGESSNWRFLAEVGAARKPTIVSFGLQTDEEALRAVGILLEAGAPEVMALHCVSLYPTPAGEARLRRIGRLSELLGLPIGISDHSVGWHLPLAAVSLGAVSIEKHLTFDKADPRSLDNAGALEPPEFIEMVRQVRELDAALSRPADDAPGDRLAQSRAWATQALVAAGDLEAGRVLGADDLLAKRPGLGGIPAAELDAVVGRTLARAVDADEQVTYDDLV
jgi:N,N'-diacetyllegionaminate synthase